MNIIITEYYWWVPDPDQKGVKKLFNSFLHPDNFRKTGKKIIAAQIGEVTFKNSGVCFSVDEITKNGVRLTARDGNETKSAVLTTKRDFVFSTGSGKDNGYRYELSIEE